MNLRTTIWLLFFLPVWATAQSDWQPLFNGKNLKGWEAVGDFDAFVEKGELVLKDRPSKKGGWLLTEARYENFEVEAEYFLPPPNNSGLGIRYDDPRGGYPPLSGYEVNLKNMPDQAAPSGTISGIARAKWTGNIAPEGWNKVRVRAEGDHLQVWINDEAVAQVHERRSLRGRIGLQCHGGEQAHTVRWRNLRIRELPATTYLGPQMEDYLRRSNRQQPVSLFDGATLQGWRVVGDARWLVVDGAIVGDTGPTGVGFLVTEQAWENFYLSYKFRLEPGHNSGVFIRADTASATVSLESSLEVNIYDPGTQLWGFPTGSIVQHARAFAGLTDDDDWNFMEIFAFGDQVCIYVNGQKTSETHVPAKYVQQGRICLQAARQLASAAQEPSQVRFKDIMIKDLTSVPFLGY